MTLKNKCGNVLWIHFIDLISTVLNCLVPQESLTACNAQNLRSQFTFSIRENTHADILFSLQFSIAYIQSLLNWLQLFPPTIKRTKYSIIFSMEWFSYNKFWVRTASATIWPVHITTEWEMSRIHTNIIGHNNILQLGLQSSFSHYLCWMC